ncbi:MAG: pyruvate/2-oxoglutarate dehydrogenase complex dihydrolipoamide dehydrogenase (E3) component [Gammaproteobacteria bacterium]|jgi:pyruvate/2-oxoglutarate dehydrogenase complex dihydrolipoamide dehydrogenase (E3) component
MAQQIKIDVCVIGAGSGGLSVAAGTAQLGLVTVLIEQNEMGGDCLNTGCVPSKALLAAAKHAQSYRNNKIKGIAPIEPEINFAAVKDHVMDTIKSIEPNDSQERFEALGVKVIRESAKFVSSDTVQAGNFNITSRYFIIATGSSPVVPPISGLERDKVLTNETIFQLREKPDHLLVIGGGPIGIEMAQAHRRLGSRVSIFDMGMILPRDDSGNVDVLRKTLIEENINIYEGISINEVVHSANQIKLIIEKNKELIEITGSHLLIATGRKPVTDGLDLEKAQVNYTKLGIKVDARLRTNKKNIFAIGDVAGGPQFTHIAGYHAGIVIRNICFKIPAKVNYHALPWVTYTDPELAQVGMTEQTARKQYGDDVKIVESLYEENDRAISERNTAGRLRVITTKRGRILGASMVGHQAGDLIAIWGLAISTKLKIGAIAGMISPYPTLGEINKRAAGAWYTPRLFSKRTRGVVKLLQFLPI